MKIEKVYIVNNTSDVWEDIIDLGVSYFYGYLSNGTIYNDHNYNHYFIVIDVRKNIRYENDYLWIEDKYIDRMVERLDGLDEFDKRLYRNKINNVAFNGYIFIIGDREFSFSNNYWVNFYNNINWVNFYIYNGMDYKDWVVKRMLE